MNKNSSEVSSDAKNKETSTKSNHARPGFLFSTKNLKM
jgi:hypothetical protein